MKNLFKVTPGFAPDYSGVCSVLYELGGLCVMIDLETAWSIVFM